MLLLGLDIGTSSIKATVLDAQTQQTIYSTNFPETEREIKSVKHGFAEQDPNQWWEDVKMVIKKIVASKSCNTKNIAAIGIGYQMHGLVCVDKNNEVLRDSIIWCDSRSVEIGEKAFESIGQEKCLTHLLNSPGNFTASKLSWVKQNEPEIYNRIYTILLPGDFIAMKFTGEITTTISALSEGIFWDFKNNHLSDDIIRYFEFDKKIIPEIQPVFSYHGKITQAIAEELSLTPGIPVTYKAGDQPNNALSLNVMKKGEVAASAGTSGVIYAVEDQLIYDTKSRINSFAHVNYTATNKNIGILLCMNGIGILNRWVKNCIGKDSYESMNYKASEVEIGSNGLLVYPFGNGAERMLGNKSLGGSFQNVDFNIHTQAHIYKATQEGIAFAFKYGFDILKENKVQPSVIRAGKSGMFLSNLFAQTFSDALQVPIEMYNNDGSAGAAIGAGIGLGIYKNEVVAYNNLKPIQRIEPNLNTGIESVYQQWLSNLNKQLK